MPDLPEPHPAVRAQEPAAFIRPAPVSKHFGSADDRAELARVRRERRDDLAALRRRSAVDWRDAP